jgi:peptidyl-prolyl cis-trans isomerase D
VIEVMPPLAPEIKDIRPQLISAYKTEKLGEALQTQTDQLVARLNRGESLSKAAGATGAQIVNLSDMDYQNAQKLAISSDPRVGQALAGKVFVTKPKESFALRFSQTQAVIGVVNKASPPPLQKAIQSMPIATMMGARTLGNDLFMQSISSSNATVKPKIYPKTAIKALGVTPPADDAAAPKKDVAAP